MKTILSQTIVYVSLLAVASGCVSSQAEEDRAKPVIENAIPVQIATVSPTDEPLAIESSGILASKAEINLSFKTGGIIANIYADEGQSVKKGQLLAKLDLSEINAAVIQARSSLDKASRDLERIDNLYQDSVATLEQRQNALTAFEVSLASLQVTEFNQKHAVIYAPQSGKILKRYAESGELIESGKTVFEFASAQSAQVIRLGVSDKDIVRVQLHDSAQVQFDAYPNVIFPAFVSEIAESADKRTGVFEIELTVNAQQHTLKNGFIGKAKIFTRQEEQYYKIPMDALVEAHEQNASIFIADTAGLRAKKLEVIPVHIGSDFFTAKANGQHQELLIITTGASYLKEGSLIHLNQ